jgi:hypothetical protein
MGARQAKHPMASPGRKYTRNQRDLLRLADLMAVKATIEQMCQRLAISDITLFKYYGRELEAAGYPIMGRRREPSDEQRRTVLHLRSCGVSFDLIGKILGPGSGFSDERSIKEAFAAEIERGDGLKISRLRVNAYDMATDWKTKGYKPTGPNLVATLFLLKTDGGMVETTRTELTGPDGQPIQHNVQHAVVILPSNGRDETPAIEDGTQTPGVVTIEGEVVDMARVEGETKE